MIEEKTMKRARELFENCSPVFLALGDAQRQNLVMDIAESGEEGLNVSTLASKSHLSRPAISHHLKVLKDYGLLEPVKKGTQIFYKLKIVDAVESVQLLLDEMKAIIEKLDL
ncbi:MAG: winged helix-turn-helix transcriptional regulator [Treponema sp.]|nr:winged helix-turn-helix transcriptional regulator [Candidatus Treponema equifaecale]